LVGYAITEPVRRAIRAMPDRLWPPALDQDGTLRDGAEVAELTGMVDLTGYPAATRIIVRRERPHPGAQLSLFDQDEGLRHQVFLTDTPHSGCGSAQFLEVRHCGHATGEDHIRCGKTTGFGRFPSRDFNVNAAWLELSPTAIDLLAWIRVLLLDGDVAAPSRKSSATGCCTSPPASPAAAAACVCGYRKPGRGKTNSPPPSIASPHCPARPGTGKPLGRRPPCGAARKGDRRRYRTGPTRSHRGRSRNARPPGYRVAVRRQRDVHDPPVDAST
jgi:hypothetical protein